MHERDVVAREQALELAVDGSALDDGGVDEALRAIVAAGPTSSMMCMRYQ